MVGSTTAGNEYKLFALNCCNAVLTRFRSGSTAFRFYGFAKGEIE